MSQLLQAAMPDVTRESAELDRLLVNRGIRSVYQPIVELYTGATVGYEALARGPGGSLLERPDLLFASARRAGRLGELDFACQEAALTGARSAGLRDPWTLFVNVEPAAARACGLAPIGTTVSAFDSPVDFQIVVELTERALTADPTELLALVARIRARGWGIAMDDVGAEPDSLALLALLRPDVIKLDLRLVQQRATAEIAEIVSAVNAEAERAGSLVLAEGIETQEHLDVALALGASLGQGWMLGRPVSLPTVLPPFVGTPIRMGSGGEVVPGRTPFAHVATQRQPRLSRKALLIEMSKLLEAQALSAGRSTVVLATFQDASFFTPATAARYARLAADAGFVGVLGQGMPAMPAPGVRGCVLSAHDSLVGEWDVAVVGPHYAACLVARDLGDTGPDAQRRFEFVFSHDRELAIQVALALMSRVWPDSGATRGA